MAAEKSAHPQRPHEDTCPGRAAQLPGMSPESA